MTIENVVGISIKKGFVKLEVLGLDTENEHRAYIWVDDNCDITVRDAETVEVDSN